MRRTNPESALVRAILDALQLLYKGRGHFWRNNTGAVKTERGRLLRFGEVGAADILGIVAPTGRLIGIEVKQRGKKATPYQEAWAAELRDLGAVVAVVSSIDEALAAVEAARSPSSLSG